VFLAVLDEFYGFLCFLAVFGISASKHPKIGGVFLEYILQNNKYEDKLV